jgi:hypothetical protein
MLGIESLEGEPILMNQLVLLEAEWVLRSRYGLLKAEIANIRESARRKAVPDRRRNIA